VLQPVHLHRAGTASTIPENLSDRGVVSTSPDVLRLPLTGARLRLLGLTWVIMRAGM
jgi:hypothetical protein